MAANSCAIETRKAQDVEAPKPRRESFNRMHVGRGGGGNFVKVDETVPGESAISDESGEESEKGRSSPKPKGLRGKVMGALGLKK